ncbi:phage tail protein [Lactiplantibacillus modestisalitolerans]|uniref:Phage tail protein n=1 Tax=Lactiplantibacillus modestisalitolerans TaxID=1457219 RepID=A0ABV5WVB0_9LACO|nr:phage tail protein [Lactiplantibacillus modestisalitolerans]
MIKFYDTAGAAHFGQATITRTTSVNGGLSLSGEIFTGDEVLTGLDYGWWLNFDDEKYVVTYKQLNDETNTIQFDAVQQFFWDFAKSALHAQYTGSHEYRFYLGQIFQDSGYTYTYDVEVPAFEKENWGYKNKLDLFNDIMSQANQEFEVHNEKVHIAPQIGSDLTSFVRKGINLSDLAEEMKISDFVTYARGYGAFNNSEDPSQGRLEVEYRSELAKKFGDLEMDPIVDERYKVASNLIAALKAKVDATYTVSMTMNIYDLENAGYPNYESPKVGDWILAIDEALNFKRKIRIIKLEEQFDAKGKRIGYTATCGDLNIVDQYTNIQSSLDSKVQRIQESVDNVAISANGKSSNYYGAKEPASANDGDLWFDQSNSDPDKWTIKQWANGRWEQLTLNPGEIDAKVSVAKQAADTAVENANTAVKNANQAVEASGLATTTANAANDAATAAKDLATSTANSFVTVQSQADTAANDASTALDQAKSALDTANGVSDNYTSFKQIVDDNSGTIKTLATSESVDAVSGRVTKAQSLAEQTADGLALKADSSTVDTLSDTVEQQGIDLKAAQGELKLKLTQSDLTNSLSGYATQTWAQNQITATATGLETQLSSVTQRLNTDDRPNLITESLQNINNWVKNSAAQEAIKNNVFSNGTNTMSYLGVGGIESISATLPTVAGNSYVVSIDFTGPNFATDTGFGWGAGIDFGTDQDHFVTLEPGANNKRYIFRFVASGNDTLYLQFGNVADSVSNTFVFANLSVQLDAVSQVTSTEMSTVRQDLEEWSAKVAKTQGDLGDLTTKFKVATDGIQSLTDKQDKQSETISSLKSGAEGFNSTIQQLQFNQAMPWASTLISDDMTNWTLNDVMQSAAKISYANGVNTCAYKGVSSVEKMTTTLPTKAGNQYVLSIVHTSPNYTPTSNAAYPYEGIGLSVAGSSVTLSPGSNDKRYVLRFLAKGNDVLTLNSGAVPDGVSMTFVFAGLSLQLDTASMATSTEMSAINQTVNGIQLTVADKANQSQVTQLSNQITSVVGGLGQPNLVYNSEFANKAEGWMIPSVPVNAAYYSNAVWYDKLSNHVVFNSTAAEGTWTRITSKPVPCVQGIPYSCSGQLVTDKSTVPKAIVAVEFLDENYNRSSTKYERYMGAKLETVATENVLPDAKAKYVRVSFEINGSGHVGLSNPMLVASSTIGPYHPDTVGYSQITQLQDRIDARVMVDGKIAAALSLSADGGGTVLITGKSVHITGQTTIDNAVIKDSMIDYIDATKIKVGTLNGTDVNIINLNADNITAGTIRGTNLTIGLDTGNVEFQKGRIHSSDNAIDINVNSKYMSVADNDNRILISGGEIQMVKPTFLDRQTTPYVRISNAVAGASWGGATFWGRDYFVVTNGANDVSFSSLPIGEERFAGISGGHATDGSWKPTKIGGAERGVFISGGQKYSDGYTSFSPFIRVGDNGYIGTGTNGSNITVMGNHIYLKSPHTTSKGANAYMSPDGELVESTSAAKYKTDIVRSFETGMGDKLLEVPVAHWKDKEEVLNKTLDPTAKNPETYFGMIADDLDEAGLNELVAYDDKGDVHGIQYDRVALALIPLIRNYRDRITELETEVKQMKEV